ncbi:MAG: 6-phosphofructokinase, partial [Defluviitaleaceae bacterium]|nr:6-phosphofructokinase [Defluviitaleaceae bacterium]
HIQRGGDTSPADRLLSLRYGVAAADMINKGLFGNMVCLKNGKMSHVSLEEVIGSAKVSKSKTVDPDGELVQVAKSLGISFAD